MDLVAVDFNIEELEEGLVVNWEYFGVEVTEVLKALFSEGIIGFEAEVIEVKPEFFVGIVGFEAE
jgi:hypothetical protein